MSIEEVLKYERAVFKSGRTKAVHFRKEQLKAMLRMFEEKSDVFLDALYADLHKSRLEAIFFEIELLKNELRLFLAKLDEWTKPEAPAKGLGNILDTVHIRNDPYGVVLIIGAWNYPFLLTLRPLIGALAAGNCCVIKPSELSPATAKAMADIIPLYLDTDCYKVICGGIPETTELLKQRFDYIFYTGSTNVGKIVRDAANVYLTPVTLEMGGKSPVYVDENVNFDVVAKRIIWGKITNAGQTCIAPDYILCGKNVEEKLIEACKQAIKQFLGDNPKYSPDYGRIINDRNYERLIKLLSNGKIAIGGQCDPYERYIEPTIIVDVKASDDIMKEEIFGPILPIVNVNGWEEAVAFINAREKPLALYAFSNSKFVIDKIVENTLSGGVCINDCLFHFACENCPFGGVGNSGIGRYFGKFSFETFTHKRTCLYRNLGALGEKAGAGRYPPLKETNINMLNALMKKRKFISIGWMKEFLIFFLGVAVAAAYFHYSK